MKVFFDTNLFIYLWEGGDPRRRDVVEAILTSLQGRRGSLVTSSLTLGEILVHPMRRGAEEAVRAYVQQFERLEIVSFDATCAIHFASIRAKYPRIKPPDAIQLSCAARAGCGWFLTNDDRLSGTEVPGIEHCASYEAFATG